MAKKDKIEQPVDTSQLSKNFLSAMLNGYKDSHFNFDCQNPVIISSGSLKLDNYIKVKSGMILRMGGPAETGKTSQSLLFADNYMKSLPKAKTIYINAEAKLSEELRKRTSLKFVTDPNEWEYGTVFVLNSNCLDTICDVLHGLYKQTHEAGEHLACVIDSVDMLMLASSLDKKMSESKKPAGINFLTKELLRRLSHMITNYNGFMIMITQYSATFTMSMYEKEAPNIMDGNQTHALNHQASYALYYRPRAASHYILETEGERPDPIKNPILGINVKIEIKKSASDNTGYTIEIPIKKGKVGNAIWVEKELFDSLFLLGLVSKKGAWIELSDIVTKWIEEVNLPIIAENEEIQKHNEKAKEAEKLPLKPLIEYKSKHQGLVQFSEYFEANPPTLNILINKIKTLYS